MIPRSIGNTGVPVRTRAVNAWLRDPRASGASLSALLINT